MDEAERLRQAIHQHWSQRADDRCVEDDDALYNAAGLPPCDRRIGSPACMLANCARFIFNRTIPGGWPNWIELATLVKELTYEVNHWPPRPALEVRDMFRRLRIMGDRLAEIDLNKGYLTEELVRETADKMTNDLLDKLTTEPNPFISTDVTKAWLLHVDFLPGWHDSLFIDLQPGMLEYHNNEKRKVWIVNGQMYLLDKWKTRDDVRRLCAMFGKILKPDPLPHEEIGTVIGHTAGLIKCDFT